MTFNRKDLTKKELTVIGLGCIVAAVCGLLLALSGCTADSAAILDKNLATLKKHKVSYRLRLDGPVHAGGELYQGFRAGTGGWVSVEVTSEGYTPPGVD